MGFWDTINAEVDKLFSLAVSPDQGASPLDAISPDSRAPDTSGVTPVDPFAVSPGELLQIQSGNSSPFTVIDLDPITTVGGRNYSSGDT